MRFDLFCDAAILSHFFFLDSRSCRNCKFVLQNVHSKTPASELGTRVCKYVRVAYAPLAFDSIFPVLESVSLIGQPIVKVSRYVAAGWRCFGKNRTFEMRSMLHVSVRFSRAICFGNDGTFAQWKMEDFLREHIL